MVKKCVALKVRTWTIRKLSQPAFVVSADGLVSPLGTSDWEIMRPSCKELFCKMRAAMGQQIHSLNCIHFPPHFKY